jgi:hypothetical protein
VPRPQREAPAHVGKRISTDGRLRGELAICETYQISHSHYLGGPALWTPEDRAKVEAYAEWKSGLCSGCGTHEDWWDPDKGGHRFAFVTETNRCPGCEIKAQEQDQIPKDAKGITVFLVPNPELAELLQEARNG